MEWIQGLMHSLSVTFDSTVSTKGSLTRCIFVEVARVGQDNVFVSEDASATCSQLASRE